MGPVWYTTLVTTELTVIYGVAYHRVVKIAFENTVTIRWKHVAIAGSVLMLLLVGILIAIRVAHHSSEGDSNTQETQQVIRLVGKHFELPTTEQPTVAKIQDKSKIADQQFFVRAHNGDYLLLYNNEKLALIYRRSTDKLINVGPISFDASQDLSGK